MAIVSLLDSNGRNEALSNLLIQPEEIDPNSSNALFASSKNQKVLDRIKRFSEVINIINNPSTVINERDQILNDTLPVVEVNVRVGESIARALEGEDDDDDDEDGDDLDFDDDNAFNPREDESLL